MSQCFWEDVEIVSVYSRADAIRDGELVDVTEAAKSHGFLMPVAMTRAVWEECVSWTDEDSRSTGWLLSSLERLSSFLHTTHTAISAFNRGGGSGQVVTATAVCFPRDPEQSIFRGYKIHCGPGDNMEPVLTIMFPHED